MKNWINFINEEYRDEIPPKYMEKINLFIDDILKENGLSRDEYLKMEKEASDLAHEGEVGLNFYLNKVSTNAFISSRDFKAKDLEYAKKFIKSEMNNMIAFSKQRSEYDEMVNEFKIIIDELTDLYKIYPKDKEDIETYKSEEEIRISITPKNTYDLLELGKIYHQIGYAINRQTFFRLLSHSDREGIYGDKLLFTLGSIRLHPIENTKKKRRKNGGSKRAKILMDRIS